LLVHVKILVAPYPLTVLLVPSIGCAIVFDRIARNKHVYLCIYIYHFVRSPSIDYIQRPFKVTTQRRAQSRPWKKRRPSEDCKTSSKPKLKQLAEYK